MFQEQGQKVDSSRRQIEDVRKCTKDKDFKKNIRKMAKQKTNRICSRTHKRQRLQEKYPEDDSVKDKQKMSKNIQNMKITKDVPTEINDEDVRQCSKTSYDI